MRVWIINQHISTPKLGKEGHRHYYLAKELYRKGFDVTLITCSYTHVPNKNIEQKKNFEIIEEEDFRVVVVKTLKYKSATSLGRIISMFEFTLKLFFLPFSKLSIPDYIIVSSLSLPPILNGFFYRKKFKSKIILEIRDIWPLTPIELGGHSKNHPFLWLLAKIEKLGYSKYDYITSLLPKTNLHIENVLGHSNFFFEHIPNGIYMEEKKKSQPLNNKTLSQIPISKDNLLIGYVGSLGEANAMDVLIEAAEYFKDSNVFFCIVGEGYLKKELQDKAKDNQNVIFINRIPKLQVNSLLEKFDILYLSWKKVSLYRFGVSANKIFDYMYSGKPILMSGYIGDDPIQISKSGISVEPENVAALIEGIQLFQSFPKEVLKEMGRNGKEYVLEHNTFDVLSDKYIHIFNEFN